MGVCLRGECQGHRLHAIVSEEFGKHLEAIEAQVWKQVNEAYGRSANEQ